MKRFAVLLLCLLLALPFLAGCGAKADTHTTLNLTPDDDVLTYERVDPERTALIVARVGNIAVQPLIEAFGAANPDIQVIYMDITGGYKSSSPFEDWLDQGLTPDVMIVGANMGQDEKVADWFVDLSAKPYTEAFTTESLNRVAKDGRIYVLPGISSLGCLFYNKTMFAEHGWQTPKTFDEFIALCKRITEETNGEIQPWNPNAKYSSEIISTMAGFTYGQILEGVDNYGWYLDYLDGKATFTGHMQPFYDAWQKLIDAGIIREEHFTYSATTRGNEFNEGKIAMLNATNVRVTTDAFEIGFIPFVGEEADDAYVMDTLNCTVGVPRNDARSEKTAAAAERFLAFYASPEGQLAFIDDGFYLSNVAGVESAAFQNLSEIQPCVASGRVFESVFFSNLWEDMQAMTLGEMTAAESMAHIDEANKKALSSAAAKTAEVVAVADADFTSLDVSNFFADMYRERTGADIGLIVQGQIFRGNVMRIFAGDITEDDVVSLKPRSFGNDATLVKLSMTGRQLKDAFNHPYIEGEEIMDAFYAFSGLKATVAPWNPLGEKYLSLRLADGSLIDDAALYTVGCWAGTVDDVYITEVLETYEGSFTDILTETLKEKGTITPVRDGRIKLVWK